MRRVQCRICRRAFLVPYTPSYVDSVLVCTPMNISVFSGMSALTAAEVEVQRASIIIILALVDLGYIVKRCT